MFVSDTKALAFYMTDKMMSLSQVFIDDVSCNLLYNF